MTPKLCAIITGPTYEQAIQQMEAECDLFELRLDYFNTLDFPKISKLLNKPCIITLRSRLEGGKFHGSEEERRHLLEKLAELKPAYIDLESTLPPSFVEKIASHAKVILSIHLFDKTPDLETLFAKLKKTPATHYKIATHANSALDSWRMLEFVKKHNCIGFCLGENGSFSRILGPLFGCPITYACLEEATAPGQLSLEELKAYKLTSQTKFYGVIGYPLTTSLSPSFHNKKYQENNIDAIYLKIPFQPHELSLGLPLLLQFGFSGLSVTMPLKESVLPFLNRIDKEAREIGAVNTIVCEKNRMIGYNVDGTGALDAIEEQVSVDGKTLIILGAGGAARALIYEAKKRGARVYVYNRTEEKAKILAKHFEVEALTVMIPYDILVNCTPADTPIEEHHILPNTYVMDIRSRPRLTPFLEKAAKKNCHLIYGETMFNYQALEQHRLWGMGEGAVPSPKETTAGSVALPMGAE